MSTRATIINVIQYVSSNGEYITPEIDNTQPIEFFPEGNMEFITRTGIAVNIPTSSLICVTPAFNFEGKGVIILSTIRAAFWKHHIDLDCDVSHVLTVTGNKIEIIRKVVDGEFVYIYSRPVY
jgi:hypothetical protein